MLGHVYVYFYTLRTTMSMFHRTCPFKPELLSSELSFDVGEAFVTSFTADAYPA